MATPPWLQKIDEEKSQRIDLAKSLFILEIEQGEEVFIPPEISIN
jgi:hypothetical protein